MKVYCLFYIFVLVMFASCSSRTISLNKEVKKTENRENPIYEELRNAVFFKDYNKIREYLKKIKYKEFQKKENIFETIAFFSLNESYKVIKNTLKKDIIKLYSYKKDRNPVLMAASKNNLYLVKEFLSIGGDPFGTGAFDRNILHIGLDNDNIDIVKIAIEYNIDPRVSGFMGKNVKDYENKPEIKQILDRYIEKYKEYYKK